MPITGEVGDKKSSKKTQVKLASTPKHVQNHLKYKNYQYEERGSGSIQGEGVESAKSTCKILETTKITYYKSKGGGKGIESTKSSKLQFG